MKAIRWIAIVVGALIVILMVAPFLIPVNQFKPAIEQRASAAMDRKVAIGNLHLSLISGSLGADDISIADDPKFSKGAFLTAKSAKVGVEMMPLIFSRTLHVTGVTIEKPEVLLLHDAAGRWNYSSIGGSSPGGGEKPEKPEKAERPPKSGEASPGSPAPADFAVNKLELTDGRITIGSTTSQKRSVYDHVNVTASNAAMTSKFPVTVTADLPGGGKFKLDGYVGPVDPADASLTPVDAKLTATSVNLAATGLLDPSLGLGGDLDVDATIQSQGGIARTKGTAKLSKALLVAGGSPSTQPVTLDYSTTYDLRKESGVLNPSALKIGNAVSHLSGTYENRDDETILNVKQSAENNPVADLQAFLPAVGIHVPKGASLQSGTISSNFTLTGPANRLVTSGNVALANAKLANFDLGSKMSGIAALAGIKSGKDLEIEKLTADVKVSPTGVEAQNFVAVVPSVGNLAGGGTIDAKNNLDFKMAATLATSSIAGGAASPVTAGAGILGKLGGGCKSTSIPFLIKGTTSDPKFLPDVGGIAASMLKTQLGCAGNVATGKTGGQQPSATDLINGISGLLGKKKPQQ
jgi:AsmA protein